MARERRVDILCRSVMSLWLCMMLISLAQALEGQPGFDPGANQGAGFIDKRDAPKFRRGDADNFDRHKFENFDNRPKNVQTRQELNANPQPAANFLHENPRMRPMINKIQNGDNLDNPPRQVPVLNQQFNQHQAPQNPPVPVEKVGNPPPVQPQPMKSSLRKAPTIKLAEHPACEKDVKMFCATSSNNFAVLDCLQNDLKSDQEISEGCQHVVWGYKKNLTTDSRFDSAAKEVCKDELDRFPDCKAMATGIGQMIPCLIEQKGNLSSSASSNCKTFLTKMASIVFSDYRLIYKFAEACQNDITKQDCGRLHQENDDSPHSQGRTVECLSHNVKTLEETCKHEILRIAELQADDYHLDRPLFYACREDRERLCKRTRAGSGKVYKCLFRHKFDRDMSSDCREKLTQRQRLMQTNYKVNKGLAQACQRDIMENKCIQETDPGFKHARLSKVVLCLEQVMKDGGEHKVEPDCIIELKEVRQSLMEDYQISPEIVAACADEITNKCGGGVHREGKTLHCLMDLAKPKAINNKMETSIGAECRAQLENLIKEADVGEDWTIDPALKDACSPVVDVHCKEIKGGEGRVLNCLMEHIDSNTMTANCEERLLEVHYFLARDFSLDPQLYRHCHKDAVHHCGADSTWSRHSKDQTPERGPLTFACLYRHLKLFPNQPDQQLSRSCAFEVRRVMRQRAIRVELEPRIEEPCMADLGAFCSEAVGKGDEMRCLQKNYEELAEECQWAVGNFTEDEDSDPSMDRVLMKSCSPMIKQFCQEMLEKDSKPGDVMDCLIEHKNDHEMDEKCAAGIEHHQLITLKDYHFSVKFKENCKEDVMKNCQGVRKKAEVIECLSEKVRNAILMEHRHDVSRKCRKQLSVEMLQRSENIQLDPMLKEKCDLDMRKYCSNVTPGNANMIECLKKNQKGLSINCHTLLFKREEVEAKDPSSDYLLMHTCKKMIKRYCMDEQPSDIFDCLKKKKVPTATLR